MLQRLKNIEKLLDDTNSNIIDVESAVEKINK
jgi:hypothetical protein